MAKKKPAKVKATITCHSTAELTNADFDTPKVPVYEAATDEKFRTVIYALDELQKAREAEDNFILLCLSRLRIQG